MLLMLKMLLCIMICPSGPAAQPYVSRSVHLTCVPSACLNCQLSLVTQDTLEFWSSQADCSSCLLIPPNCCLHPSVACFQACTASWHTYQEVKQATMPCRAYQQVELLNSLQSYMLTPHTPCGHASRLREQQQQQQQTPHLSTSTMNPVVMSYLASNRLSSLPASFDVFAQVRNHACLCFLIFVSGVCFCTF